MMDLENLLEYLKLPQDAKDIAEMEDIICDIRQLDYLYQLGNWSTVGQFIQQVIDKHKEEAIEHDKGRTPAQDIHQLYRSCRGFLLGLGIDKIKEKAKGELVEKALKHLGEN